MSRPAGEPGGVQAGQLAVIATPIGNLDDLSPRAAQALRDADLVLCEDTRHSAGLLGRVGSRARTLSLHAHNEVERVGAVLEQLRAGARVALVSDAGTPTLSDPGAMVVAAARDAGCAVVSIPGPCAAVAALAGAGGVVHPFAFWGFLPKKESARRAFLRQRALPAPDGAPMAHVFYAPGRDLADVLGSIAAVVPQATVVIARELTKIHESWWRGTAVEVAAALPAEALRGEAVVIVQADAASDVVAPEGDDPAALERELDAIAALATPAARKEALRALAKATGLARRTLYQALLPRLRGAAADHHDAATSEDAATDP